ncbi:MAG TPA: hypothetical protein DIW52_25330 [Pseudomonas sp.]|jgi:hypothetical protein|nr:hypothetical protein [Pseudomonas sp.]
MNTIHRDALTLPLLQTVACECALPVAADLHILVEVLRSRFGDALEAMLFYGSCLRDGELSERLVDLYVVVDDYASLRSGGAAKLLHKWLPPMVFQLKTQTPDGRTLRAKCAVISLEDFEAGTSVWFQSYLWGRFSQPSRLVYYRNETIRDRVHVALCNAVIRMMSETVAAQERAFDSSTFWEQALSMTYGTELRPERANRPAEIVMHNADYYARVTQAAAYSIPALSPCGDPSGTFINDTRHSQRRTNLLRWKIRRLQGRTLNVLRLIKSFFTFEDGVGYVIWKLERHLGEPIHVTTRLRRYPLIFCWPLLWRLLKDRRLR